MWLVFADNIGGPGGSLNLSGGDGSVAATGADIQETRQRPRYYGYNNSYRYIKVPSWISAISLMRSRLSSLLAALIS
jgi:hypothetical protein